MESLLQRHKETDRGGAKDISLLRRNRDRIAAGAEVIVLLCLLRQSLNVLKIAVAPA